MKAYLIRNLGKIVHSIFSRFVAMDNTMDEIYSGIGAIRATLHDSNIISFTVTGTTSGTVTYIRQ